MKLIDFIGNDAVIDDLCSTDKEAVIREMVEILKKLNKIKESDVDRLRELYADFKKGRAEKNNREDGDKGNVFYLPSRKKKAPVLETIAA